MLFPEETYIGKILSDDDFYHDHKSSMTSNNLPEGDLKDLYDIIISSDNSLESVYINRKDLVVYAMFLANEYQRIKNNGDLDDSD